MEEVVPLRQEETPLFDAVIKYAKDSKVSFHTPGHKHGVSIPQEFRNFVGERIFDCDLTLLEEVDSLHEPRSVIKRAQQLAATAWKADRAFFLVNGTSGGNHAMILTVCDPGEKIIVPRNAHRSVLAGIVLAGARPVYIMPEYDLEHDMLLNVSPRAVQAAIEAHPDAKACLITHPSYTGIATQLESISEVVHRAGMHLLVDEAHGPHLAFHPALPPDAMRCGADLCVQSTHKIISSMTQASMLLARNTVDLPKLKRILHLLMTTSPSYILMSSLDVARMQMATRGQRLLEVAILLAEEARRKINEIPGFACYQLPKMIENDFSIDITKIYIDVTRTGCSGYEISRLLNQRHNVQVEFADPHGVLLIVSIGNTSKDITRLCEALQEIARCANKNLTEDRKRLVFPIQLPEMVHLPRAAVFSSMTSIPLDQAEGRICAETLCPYPPGVPLVNPGERITRIVIDYVTELHQQGGIIQGLTEEPCLSIKVMGKQTTRSKKEKATHESTPSAAIPPQTCPALG